MKNNRKGFTLAELLIVVAIIAVLVAIAIPIFTNQLEKAREATDLSNIRAAYAEAVAAYLDSGKSQTVTYSLKSETGDVLTTGDVAGVDVSKILNTATCTIEVNTNGAATINGEAVLKNNVTAGS